jgi:hypothetical protein
MELKKERGDHEEDDVGIERTTHDNAEAKTCRGNQKRKGRR